MLLLELPIPTSFVLYAIALTTPPEIMISLHFLLRPLPIAAESEAPYAVTFPPVISILFVSASLPEPIPAPHSGLYPLHILPFAKTVPPVIVMIPLSPSNPPPIPAAP